MSETVDAMMRGLAVVFTPSTALVFALLILAFTAIGCAVASLRLRGLMRALSAANGALEPVRQAGEDEARRALRDSYQDVSAAIRGGQCPHLERAWREFEQSIADPQADVLISSTRVDEFFYHLEDRSRGLVWWANIAVAVGLVLTFLGIMAALGSTAATIGAAASSGAMQVALQTLLGVTAAKFLTSAAGVLASILLRAWDRHLERQLHSAVRSFVETLEKGLVFRPPQHIAAAQERHLEQIATAQTKFAQELAVAIGEKFSEQVTPMVTVLGEISASITGLKKEMTEGLGETVGASIGATAGKEMQALAAALAAMADKLGTVPDRLGATADDANTRIHEAAQLFSQASAGMATTFDTLERRIREMGEAMAREQQTASAAAVGQLQATQSEWAATARRNAEAMQSAGEEMKGLLAGVGGALAAIQAQLVEQAQAAARANEEAGTRARDVLRETVRQAASDLNHAAAEGAREASERAAAALEVAFAKFADRFEVSGRQLTSGIDTGSVRLQAFGGSLERAAERADSQAEKLASASLAAERLGGQLTVAAGDATNQLGKAAAAIAGAADPLQSASQQIARGVEEVARAVQAQRDSAAEQATQFRAMAQQIESVASAAQRAFADYEKRFQGVDDSLGAVFTQVVDAAADTGEKLNKYATELDRHLADAVNRLQGVVETLADLPDLVEQATRSARAV